MKRVLPISLLATMISGCINTVPSPDARDISGKFDGDWVLTVTIDRETQQAAGHEFTCPKQKFQLPAQIEDGFLTVNLGRLGDFEGIIEPNGDLHLRQEIGEFNTSNAPNDRADIVLRGTLNEKQGEGIYIHAIHETDMGCKGHLTAQRSESA